MRWLDQASAHHCTMAAKDTRKRHGDRHKQTSEPRGSGYTVLKNKLAALIAEHASLEKKNKKLTKDLNDARCELKDAYWALESSRHALLRKVKKEPE